MGRMGETVCSVADMEGDVVMGKCKKFTAADIERRLVL